MIMFFYYSNFEIIQQCATCVISQNFELVFVEQLKHEIRSYIIRIATHPTAKFSLSSLISVLFPNILLHVIHITRKYANFSILVTFEMMFFSSKKHHCRHLVRFSTFDILQTVKCLLFSFYVRNKSANKTMLKYGTLLVFIIYICYIP